MDEFRETLWEAYRAAPCQVLPNPLWKTLCRMGSAQTLCETRDGLVAQLALWDEAGLYMHWQRDRQRLTLPVSVLEEVRFALVHADFVASIPPRLFRQRQPYFRLLHWGAPTAPATLEARFAFAPAQPITEAATVSDLICRSYETLQPTPEMVLSWTTHAAYDPQLWLWVVDRQVDRPVGLGIAERDPTVPEGSLEWIQVLPAYRRRGLGSALVCELLRRLADQVAFTTVSGEQANAQALALYRRCGFGGDDVWWLLEK